MTDLWETAANHEQSISQLTAEIAQINERLDVLEREIKDHQTGRDGVTSYHLHQDDRI